MCGIDQESYDKIDKNNYMLNELLHSLISEFRLNHLESTSSMDDYKNYTNSMKQKLEFLNFIENKYEDGSQIIDQLKDNENNYYTLFNFMNIYPVVKLLVVSNIYTSIDLN